jgi:hypothetical protein
VPCAPNSRGTAGGRRIRTAATSERREKGTDHCLTPVGVGG